MTDGKVEIAARFVGNDAGFAISSSETRRKNVDSLGQGPQPLGRGPEPVPDL